MLGGFEYPAAAFISGLFEGGGGGERYPINWAGKRWATSMGKQYPEFEGLPEIAPEAMELVSRLMRAKELPSGVEEALGIGTERAKGVLGSRLSERGAGITSLGMGEAGIMQDLAMKRAGLLWEGLFKGLGAAPEISELMMKPYDIERQRWGDIANLFLAVPGAAALKPGQSMGFVGDNYPSTSAPTAPATPQKTNGYGGYDPIREIWKRTRQAPTGPTQTVSKPSGYGTYGRGPGY